MLFEDNPVPVIDPFTGQPQINPATNEPLLQHDRMVTSRNNVIYLENVPVFYWPVMKNDVEQSSFYIRQARFKSDRIFGEQILVDWDAYQILGLKRLPGTDWTFSTDYFSARGPALGTAYKWKGSELFGLQGPYNGFVDAWGIHDHGLDTLGSDRMNLLPEPDIANRYKVLARHRQYLQNNFQLTGEFGLISDRNFLEQYFEREWDQAKDYDTDLGLKQYRGNSTWEVYGSRGSTTGSPRRNGCLGRITTGSASRSSTIGSPGTSTPAWPTPTCGSPPSRPIPASRPSSPGCRGKPT